MRLFLFAFVFLFILPSVIHAQVNGRGMRQPSAARATQQRAVARRPTSHEVDQQVAVLGREMTRAIAHRVNSQRRADVRSAGRFFRKITVNRDYTNEYVLMTNAEVTAFLDLTDPEHPLFDSDRPTHEPLLDAIPVDRRVHVIVVPNRPREHIATDLGDTIGLGDLEATLTVVREAERFARDLGLRNPQVFLNSESVIGVGYLHVHIVGERTAQTRYPRPVVDVPRY